MYKKILISVIALFSICGYAIAEPTDFPHGVTTGTQSQKSSAGYTIEEGDAYIQDDLYVNGDFQSTDGFMTYRDMFNDLEALSVTKNFNTDVATTTLVAAATTYTGALITQPTNPMNIVAEVTFADGESTTTVTGTLYIVGVNARGESATETLTISTTQATGAVAFASITSLTWTITAITGRETTTNASLQCGNGTKVGLSNDIQAAGDIIQVIYDDSGTSADDASYTLNTTYDTIIFGTTNDGTTDVGTVVYKVKKR